MDEAESDEQLCVSVCVSVVGFEIVMACVQNCVT